MLIIYIISAHIVSSVAFKAKDTFLIIKRKLHFDVIGLILFNVLVCIIFCKIKNTFIVKYIVSYGYGICNLTIGILL